METFLTKEEWIEHTNAEREHQAAIKDHAKRVQHLELAMFGDDMFPETVKNAIMPTMVRLNTCLDMAGKTWRVLLYTLGTLATCAIAAKTLGWI